MKNRVGKKVLGAGMLSVACILACACGKGAGEAKEAPIPLEEAARQEDWEDPQTKEPEISGENDGETDIARQGQADVENASEAWMDGVPDMEGEIKEISDGQITIIEAVTEKLEDNAEIMVLPSGEDDSEFHKVTVTYNENALFKIKTIYEGGARFEMSEATAADLACGQLVEVWGSDWDGCVEASQICIVKIA